MTQDIIEKPPEDVEKIYYLPTPTTVTIYSEIPIVWSEFESGLKAFLDELEDLPLTSRVAIVVFDDIYQSNFTMSLYELTGPAPIPRSKDQNTKQELYEELSDFNGAEFLNKFRYKLNLMMKSEEGELYVENLIWHEHLEEQLMVCLLRALRHRFGHLSCWVGAHGETGEEWVNRREWLPENV